MVDHLGRLMDGDRLLYIIARDRHSVGELTGPVVDTVMSNLGLEVAMKKMGGTMVRTAVGDRYVVEEMRKNCDFVKITGAGLKESHVHDVQITRESPNYRAG